MSKATGTVNIHGRDYETVASRVQKFREKYPPQDGWAIETELIERNESDVVVKAYIKNYGLTRATGYAEESRSASTINKTSALENCETSAIGRALAAFGLAGTEYASADEVAQAISQQAKPTAKFATDKQLKWLRETAARIGKLDNQEDIDKWIESQLGVHPTKLSIRSVKQAVDRLQAADLMLREKDAKKPLPVVDVPKDTNLEKLPY
jgi:hypothetical protein